MIATEKKRPGDVGFDQTAFNLARWEEVLEDSFLHGLEERIETDRLGHIVMSPPPVQQHGGFQFEIGLLLRTLLPNGRVITECPVSTSEGVKGCDVVWISRERHEPQRRLPCLTLAPEICVEVVSPSNSRTEIEEKQRLYFEAGAEEVWLCDAGGRMRFCLKENTDRACASTLCPNFPATVEIA